MVNQTSYLISLLARGNVKKKGQGRALRSPGLEGMKNFFEWAQGGPSLLGPCQFVLSGSMIFGVFDLKLGFQQSNSGLAWCVLLLKVIIILVVKILWTQRCSGVSWWQILTTVMSVRVQTTLNHCHFVCYHNTDVK